ncbi:MULTISPECIES: hypothetical protein [Pseudomonas fluorescens group]|uniref:hypothetical protein n=1 Tax=Pseudomonas fluorescens group TaxID=136843 RepID=UPI000FFE460F|nr:MULTISPECIES: hypothetical protein [Pseudomonas fluorescens group]
MKSFEITDLRSPIKYEKRTVVFFDVLGWKGLICEAGDDPEKIGKIALIPRLLNSIQVLEAAEKGSQLGSRITNFSDCCVVSIPFNEDNLPNFIYGLSNIFIGCALEGFLLRAGLTIGKIHHEEKVVFGPAMNRAHQLESTGVYPRIIIDPETPELENAKIPKSMISKDEKGSFINPYDWSFVKSVHCLNPIPAGSFMGIKSDPALTLFTILQEALLKTLNKATLKEHRERANWPYSMVRRQHKDLL